MAYNITVITFTIVLGSICIQTRHYFNILHSSDAYLRFCQYLKTGWSDLQNLKSQKDATTRSLSGVQAAHKIGTTRSYGYVRAVASFIAYGVCIF